MVRTRADGAGSKAVGSKAPRKNFGGSSSGGGGSSSASSSPSSNKNKYSGGNPVCPRPIPDWQKGIGHFFNKENTSPNSGGTSPGEKESGEEMECGGSAECGASGSSSTAQSSSSSKDISQETEAELTEDKETTENEEEGQAANCDSDTEL